MKNKKLNIIGKTFATWKVLKNDEHNKVKVICRCTICGAYKSINKYNLTRNKFKCCKNSCIKSIVDDRIISKHWNAELNNCNYNGIEGINMSRSYWFVCENGHNIRSKVVNFESTKCLSCTNKNTETIVSRVYNLLEQALRASKISYNKDILGIEIPCKKLYIRLLEIDRYKLFKKYFNSEHQMMQELEQVHLLKLELANKDTHYLEICLDSSYHLVIKALEKQCDL